MVVSQQLLIVQKDALSNQGARSGSLVPDISLMGRDIFDRIGWVEFFILEQRLDASGYKRFRSRHSILWVSTVQF